MIDQQYYIEENRMLRELAQHWEKMYNEANEDRVSTTRKYDKAVEWIQHLELDYEKIKKNMIYDNIFWAFRNLVYYDKSNENPDPEDLVYCFAQWVQNDGRILLKQMLKTSEDGVSKAIDEILTGCTKWEEGNEQTN